MSHWNQEAWYILELLLAEEPGRCFTGMLKKYLIIEVYFDQQIDHLRKGNSVWGFLALLSFFYLRDSKFTAINWIFYQYTWTKVNWYKPSEKFKYSEAQIKKLQTSTPSVDCLWFCPTCIILLHTSLKPHLHLQVNPLLRLWQWFLLLQRSWQHLRYYCEYYLKCTKSLLV